MEKDKEKLIKHVPSKKAIEYFNKKYKNTPLIHAKLMADFLNIPVGQVDDAAGIAAFIGGSRIKDDGEDCCFLSPNAIITVLTLLGKANIEKKSIELEDKGIFQYLIGKSMVEASRIDDRIVVVEENQEEDVTVFNIKLKGEIEG